MPKRRAYTIREEEEEEEEEAEFSQDNVEDEPPMKHKKLSKLSKASTGKSKKRDISDDEEDDEPVTKKRKARSSISKAHEDDDDDGIVIKANDEGEKYIDLGKKRRATVSTFKGLIFLDIREYFGPECDEKPGKKGVTLQWEQWEKLKNSSEAIDKLFTQVKRMK
ncbi:PC4-domain-containing protein [Laetiporus sulphureus 93-53]|uniref:PC4-domain-containing protein n=1 Tax=Laetiporus sulphureus 93-53 TaxID=1314785 RepID=A0A165GXV8_9APHY|nr:PC4-domain-containing protein [Laetiporus sulphureus 93-53]KZT10977.1 PC4-domain-containing protein [Laetiporus sulphureus 93-53]